MASQHTQRSSWGEHRAQVFEHAEVILDLLDRGWTATAIRTRLDLEAVPLRTFHDNVRKLRDRTAQHHRREEKPAMALPAEKDITGQEEAAPPSSDTTITTDAPRPRRKKRKFVSATVGGEDRDDLNPLTWRKERRARQGKEP